MKNGVGRARSMAVEQLRKYHLLKRNSAQWS